MDVSAAEIRRLVDLPPTGAPVTSVYLNTDGARFPRPADYQARLDGLLRDVRKAADGQGDQAAAVRADADAISRWVRDEFDRGDVRGIGVYASRGKLLDTVQTALPVRNVAKVDDRPYVVPLEALLSRSHHLALVAIERERARIFRYRLGRTWEWYGVASDVHRRHEQGGWSQKRFQLGIEHEVLHHFKDTVEVLRRLHEDEPLDALVLSGPHHEVVDFTRQLHPYLEKVLHDEQVNLAADAGMEAVKSAFAEVEQTLVSRRRAELLGRLAAAQGQAEKAARGVRHVVEAMNLKRVEVLFVVEGAGVPGFRSSTGALALHEAEAAAYGEPVTPVGDLIDELIEEAVRSGAQIELFRDEVRLDGHPVAALLRF